MMTHSGAIPVHSPGRNLCSVISVPHSDPCRDCVILIWRFFSHNMVTLESFQNKMVKI